MKKFISGIVTGALLTSTIALAATYVAEPATFKVLVNGKDFTSDPPALVVNGSTYLPLRAVGDALGVPVNWNAELKQAEVGTPPAAAQISDDVQTNDKWKMTYLSYKTLSQIDEYTKAPEGKEFLVAFFEVENVSTENQNFSLFNTDFYIDDFKTSQSIVGYQIDDAMPLVATQVEPNKKVKGYFIFDVSHDWSKLEVVYNEDLLKEDNENVMKFTLTR